MRRSISAQARVVFARSAGKLENSTQKLAVCVIRVGVISLQESLLFRPEEWRQGMAKEGFAIDQE